MRKSVGKTATLYLKHLGIAWPGVTIGALVLGALPNRLGLIWLFGIPNGAPFFVGWLGAGAVLGYVMNSKDRTRAAYLTFIPALAMLLTDLPGTLHMSVDGGWAGVWTAYFSKNCSSSECLNELLMTAPLYACAAYSLAAWAALRRDRRTTERSAKLLDPPHFQ
ncbi:MAG TPA: hypothetical protein VN709_07565 [Terriglobales bacterium]|nr:hypothetical protein [Terriglobales bacterium]